MRCTNRELPLGARADGAGRSLPVALPETRHAHRTGPLTHEDLADRKRYLNARSTLRTLLGLNVIPIINENDTVATDEIRFGDNDTLVVLVTNLIEANAPATLPTRPACTTRIPPAQGRGIDQRGQGRRSGLEKMAGGVGSDLGSGGMLTKVLWRRGVRPEVAPQLTTASGREPDVLVRLAGGGAIGTELIADTMTLAARKQWLADHLQVRGKLTLDDGAVRALKVDGKSLLAIGV